MNKAKRFISVLTVLAFISVIVFSSCFVIFCSHHHCDGEDCFVCRFINECVANFNKLSAVFLLLLIFLTSVFASLTRRRSDSLRHLQNTPVSLCDKISC